MGITKYSELDVKFTKGINQAIAALDTLIKDERVNNYYKGTALVRIRDMLKGMPNMIDIDGLFVKD